MAVYDAAINALTDDMMRRAESMSARELRFAGHVTTVTAAQDDLRARLATLQQATLTLKREVERLLAGGTPAPATTSEADTSAAAPVIDSYKYVGFEDRFRGSQEDIRARLEPYVAMFHGAGDVLDVGCGRGELLDLLRKDGILARGLDLNHEMVEVCRERGPRRGGGGSRPVSRRAARRRAWRSDCDPGRRTPRTGVPDARPRPRLPQAAARLKDRPRDHQSRLLVRVLCQLHSRPDPRPSDPPRDVAVPARPRAASSARRSNGGRPIR